MNEAARPSSLAQINAIFSRLKPHDVEQFYALYQRWSLYQRIQELQQNIAALMAQLDENAAAIECARPSSMAFATLARLQACGVEDAELLDQMLERGEDWLDRTIQHLEYCERMGVIRGDYEEWCRHALEDAFDWIDTVQTAAITIPSDSPDISTEITIPVDTVAALSSSNGSGEQPPSHLLIEELFLQKLMSEDEEVVPSPDTQRGAIDRTRADSTNTENGDDTPPTVAMDHAITENGNDSRRGAIDRARDDSAATDEISDTRRGAIDRARDEDASVEQTTASSLTLPEDTTLKLATVGAPPTPDDQAQPQIETIAVPESILSPVAPTTETSDNDTHEPAATPVLASDTVPDEGETTTQSSPEASPLADRDTLVTLVTGDTTAPPSGTETAETPSSATEANQTAQQPAMTNSDTVAPTENGADSQNIDPDSVGAPLITPAASTENGAEAKNADSQNNEQATQRRPGFLRRLLLALWR